MTVRTETLGDIFVVTIDRESVRNAVDRPTADALADAFRAFDKDDSLSVGVLHGANGTFCAGADLKAIANGNGNRLNVNGDAPMGPSRMLLGKPVIAAIEGHAVAGGLELVLWCDLRVVAESAVMGVFCRRWGVPLIDGGTVRLPRLIGLSRALDLILTGRPVDAKEALQIGLANRVVPDGTARNAAIALAKEIASFPQLCMKSDRLSAYTQFDHTLEDAIAGEFILAQPALKNETVKGAQTFADGVGRHGSFDKE